MSDLMSERYGAGNAARRRVVIAISGVVGLVALGWLVWVMWFQSNPEIRSSLRTFDVVDAHTVDVNVQLRVRDKDVDANCLVRATGLDRSVVGELNFEVSGISGTVHRDVTVRTEREATSVEMIGCTTESQKRPR